MNKKLTSSLLALTLAFSGFPIANYTPIAVVQADDEVSTVATVAYDQPGVLDSDTTTHAVNTLNYIRYIAGLGYNVAVDTTYNTKAQAASYLNNYNGYMSHYPAYTENYSGDGTTPGTASSAQDDLSSRDYYDNGVYGAKESNLGTGSSTSGSSVAGSTSYPKPMTLSEYIVNGWMEDGDSSNIAKVGHRRWCLDPNMTKTGFGQVTVQHDQYEDGGFYWNETETHTAMYVQDASTTSTLQGVIWPAQNTPTDVFTASSYTSNGKTTRGDSYPWSYTYGKNFTGNVTVTLTELSGSDVYTFSSTGCTKNEVADSSLYYSLQNESSYAGQPGCVIFDPEILDYSAGDVFWVEIKDGSDVVASYPVEFFTLGTDTGVGLSPATTTNNTSYSYNSTVIGTITGVGVNTPTKAQISSFYNDKEIATAMSHESKYTTQPDTDKTSTPDTSDPTVTTYSVTTTGVKNLTYSSTSSATEGSTSYTGTLKASTEYSLPSSIKVTMNGTELSIGSSGYTYDATTGVIAIKKAIDGNITITAEGVAAGAYVADITGVTLTTISDEIQGDDTYTFTGKLVAERDYTLPSSVVVKMDGVTHSTVDYDETTGEIVITKVNGDIVITTTDTDYKLPELPTPVINGDAEVGFELSVTVAENETPVDPSLYTIQWYADGVAVAGETGSTYTPEHADLGKVITVKIECVKNSDDSYSYTSDVKTSAATDAIEAFYDITFKDENGGVITTIGADGVIETQGNATIGSTNFPADLANKTENGKTTETFAGWYTSADVKVTADTVFTVDTPVTAKFVEVEDITSDIVPDENEDGTTSTTSTVEVVAGKIPTIDLAGIDSTITDIVVTTEGNSGVSEFFITSAPDAEDITITLPDVSGSETVTWTIETGDVLAGNVNLAVTINGNDVNSDTSADDYNTNGSITFAHSGDLVESGSAGLRLQFPVPNGSISSNYRSITLNKRGSSDSVTAKYISSKIIEADFNNCSTWDVVVVENTSSSNNNDDVESSPNTTTGALVDSNVTTTLVSTESISASGYSYDTIQPFISFQPNVTSNNQKVVAKFNVDSGQKIALFEKNSSGSVSEVYISYATLAAMVTRGFDGIINNNTLSTVSSNITIGFSANVGSTYTLAYVTTSSGGSYSSGNTYSAAYYDSGNVRVNGTVIPALQSVLVGEMINLNNITTVNGREVLGWYYDEALTNQITNTSQFVITSDIIANGLFVKLSGVSDTLIDGSYNAGAGGVVSGSNTDTTYTPSAVPSTIAKILSKLF